MFRPHRRYLTFSLRTLFILLTLFAVWTATIVNRAREQREAVKAIEALGGEVLYGPFAILNWQRTGNDYFQNVEIVKCPVGPSHADQDILRAIPHLKRFRRLKGVFWGGHSDSIKNRLKEALPNCDVIAGSSVL